MAAGDRMQTSRYEMKYLLSEETALRMRDFVQCHLNLDEYSVSKPNLSYPVHSLYLDSDDLALYWQTINGNKNRYKLRLRYYSTTPKAPIFFEVKRRMNNCILKQRGGVRQDMVERLLSGELPDPSFLVSDNPKAMTAIQRFCQLMSEIHAKPKVHIAYLREAYVSDNDQVRLTLDRNVRGEAHLHYGVKTDMAKFALSYKNMVILELKFTDRFPTWFGDLVRSFNIMQCGAAKYVESVQGLGHRALQATAPVLEEDYRAGINSYDGD